MKGYGPASPPAVPRVAGRATLLRLPYVVSLDGVDVAVLGLPFEGEAGSHTGARFGPRAIREASLSLRPFYNPAQRVAPFDHLSVVDCGDLPGSSGFVDPAYRRVVAELASLHAAGVIPLCLGGDRSIVLPQLRAAAEVHGALALVALSARVEAAYGDATGAPSSSVEALLCAAEEGLVDPARSSLLGARGGFATADELERLRERGFLVVGWEELAQLGTGAITAVVDRAAGAAHLSFSLDFVDPAFAPGVAAPECGGPTSLQALALLRACRGLQLVGADVVEVIQELDCSRLTATLAATVVWEMLSLIATAPARSAPAGA